MLVYVSIILAKKDKYSITRENKRDAMEIIMIQLNVSRRRRQSGIVDKILVTV